MSHTKIAEVQTFTTEGISTIFLEEKVECKDDKYVTSGAESCKNSKFWNIDRYLFVIFSSVWVLNEQ